MWVGLKDTEELTFCSVHLPSWVDDISFELAVVEALEAGRSRASGSIVMGIDANCNVDSSDDQRGALVKELCAVRGLLPLFPTELDAGVAATDRCHEEEGKVDFIFSNQSAAIAAIAEDLHSRSDHKPLCLTRPQVRGVMLEFARKKKPMAGWFPQTLSQHHDLQISISQRTHLGSTVGQIQQVFESVMSEVDAERPSQICDPLTDTEKCFDSARRDLQTLVSSGSSQAFNSSSLGVMQPHELLTFEEIQRQKRIVVDLRAKVAAERRLLTLRRLSSKVINKRMPSPLRDSTGQHVQDQSRWGHLIHEHFQKKSDATTPRILRPRGAFWRTRVRYAVQRGLPPGILSYEEFQEAMRMVKSDAATGRDNVPGSILRFFPEITQTRLYYAVVERLAGREDTHVKDWAEFDVCLVPKQKKETSRTSADGDPSPWFPPYTSCMRCACGKCWTKNSNRFRVSCSGSDRVDNAWTVSSFWWKVCVKLKSGVKFCSSSPWMWRALSIRSEPIFWVMYCCNEEPRLFLLQQW